jgi:hypothetical protein
MRLPQPMRTGYSVITPGYDLRYLVGSGADRRLTALAAGHRRPGWWFRGSNWPR